MDCITNGLDTATAYDIIRAIRVINQSLGTTNLISLLQVRSMLFFPYLTATNFIHFNSLLQMSIASSMKSFSSVKVISSIKAIERVPCLILPPWATSVLIRWTRQTSCRSCPPQKDEDS